MNFDFLDESHIVIATTDYVPVVMLRDEMIARLIAEREAEFNHGK
jgi:hypothetical protein